MQPADLHGSSYLNLTWIDFGSAIAAALFGLLVLYTLLLAAAARRRPLPGLRWLAGKTLHRDLTIGLSLLALLPALALGLVLAERAAEQREERAASLLSETTRVAGTRLDALFTEHRNAMAALASSIARAQRFDRTSLAEWLEAHHAIYRDYLTTLAADASGDIVAATALMDGQPQRIMDLAHNVTDRPYFAAPMRDGGAYVSDVFRGRGLGADPIVAISHAVDGADGQRWGIVEGSLDLRTLARFGEAMRAFEYGAELMVVDGRNRVIYASDAQRYPPLSRLSASTIAPAGHPALANGSVWRDASGRFLVAASDAERGWRVIARLPLRPILAGVVGDLRITALWLLATVLVAALLSAALARRVRKPLARLAAAVRALDLDGIEARIEAPPGAPDEIRAVYQHLATVSQRLHKSYRQLSAASEAGKHYRDQLEQTLDRRDAEIESRTRELEHSNARLRELSNVDPLTGLANRRHFHETIDRVWRHGMREQSPVAVAIVDLDHFKAYNDSYGHQGGDQCLVRVATAMASVVNRSLDLVARCGGEEFMLVLGNTALDDALTIAERTRQLIEDLAIPHKGSSTDSIVTLSCGVAGAVPQRGSHYDELVRLADRALYYAKENGRNVVASARGEHLELYGSPARPHDNQRPRLATLP